MPAELTPQAARAWEIFQLLRKEELFPLKVTIENSQVIRIQAGSKDITDELEILTNKRRQLLLTEMAFSTNESLDPGRIDWTINSQLNEGAAGIHVGIGDGLTGAHIDFICPGVTLRD